MTIKYPFPKKATNSKQLKTRTYGMLLENELNITNEYYRINNKALIYKKPTPVQVVKVDYKSRSTAKIIEAYYRTPSTTDYNGIYRGRYIDYEAKETNNPRFAFKHIFPHQIEHLKSVYDNGGISFVLIYYKKINEVILIDANKFYELYKQGEAGGVKSISIEKALEIGTLIKKGYTPPLDYLLAVDKIYF